MISLLAWVGVICALLAILVTITLVIFIVLLGVSFFYNKCKGKYLKVKGFELSYKCVNKKALIFWLCTDFCFYVWAFVLLLIVLV